jgi:UDP-N-acetylglucosamine 2-epimerase (non-hydrolysing)
VCFIVGARPNFMKAAPVYRALEELDSELELLLIHTGQHYDTEMSTVFLEELELPHPDVFLGVGSGTHAEQTAKALVGVEQVLLERWPVLVVVAGDVNSTLAGALAASKLQVPVAHIESGLRSFDESMPEEANRRLTDHLSRLLLAHSQSAVENLVKEGVEPTRVYLIGNTMIDSVVKHLPAALERRPWEELGIEQEGYGLVTLHRPALVDDPRSNRAPGVPSPSTYGDAPLNGGTRALAIARGGSPALLAPRLPRFFGPRGKGGIRPHGLGRPPGGNVRTWSALLHATRHDRATGDR